MYKHNFSAGPGILPREVIEEAAQTVLNHMDSGLSILEVSHRTKEFEPIMEEAQALVRELLGLSDDYAVMFLQGGASLQFTMVPMNLLTETGYAAYFNTGVWASKAIKEAKMIGRVEVVASSEDKNFSYIPKGFEVPTDADYYHITSNNTIYGTQLHSFPTDVKVPLVCDMSSDIFSRPIDASNFDLIYAGAQKNMGPAGTTLVIVKKELFERSGRKIPSMLNYKVQDDNGSMFNTPPVFAVYVSMLTLRWVKANGGLAGMEVRNREKAELFYSSLDANPMFKGTVAKEDRSWMNANFVLEDPSQEGAFNELLKEAGIYGLKGHRSVGGYRASMYNALDISSVRALTEVMHAFAQQPA